MELTDTDRALIETWFDPATSLLAMASAHSMTVVDLATWANQTHIHQRIATIESVAQRRTQSLIAVSQEQALATLLRVAHTESASPETKRKAAGAIARAASCGWREQSAARVARPSLSKEPDVNSSSPDAPSNSPSPNAPPRDQPSPSLRPRLAGRRASLVASWLVTALASISFVAGCVSRPHYMQPPTDAPAITLGPANSSSAQTLPAQPSVPGPTRRREQQRTTYEHAGSVCLEPQQGNVLVTIASLEFH